MTLLPNTSLCTGTAWSLHRTEIIGVELCEKIPHHSPTRVFSPVNPFFLSFPCQLPHHPYFRQLKKLSYQRRARLTPHTQLYFPTRKLIMFDPSRSNAPTNHNSTPDPLHSTNFPHISTPDPHQIWEQFEFDLQSNNDNDCLTTYD